MRSLALALLLSAVAAPTAGAAWSPATTLLRPAGEGLRADAGGGFQAFAWQRTSKRLIRTPTRKGFAGYVQARVRLADGRLGRVQTLSRRPDRLVSGVAIALDGAGNATAVWTEAGPHYAIVAAVRPRNGRFGRPFRIGRSGTFIDARPALEVAPGGAAVVAWNSGRTMKVARRPAGRCPARAARGCFGAVQDLPSGSDQAVAISPRGSALVVWAAGVRAPGTLHTELRVAVALPRARRFATPRAVSSTADASQPTIDVAPDGSAAIAWRASLPVGAEQDMGAAIMAAVRAPDGQISTPQAVSQFPGKQPRVRVDPRGEAILAWNQSRSTPQNPDGHEVAAAVRPAAAGASFGAPQTLSPPDYAAGSASLAIDGAGTAFLAYSAAQREVRVPVGIFHMRTAGAAFGPADGLPPDFTGAFVLADGRRVSAVSGGSGGATLVGDFTR